VNFVPVFFLLDAKLFLEPFKVQPVIILILPKEPWSVWKQPWIPFELWIALYDAPNEFVCGCKHLLPSPLQNSIKSNVVPIALSFNAELFTNPIKILPLSCG
jgi:hypothetical protein